jgi:glycosyltransferase involved in cell wall biosynthesis
MRIILHNPHVSTWYKTSVEDICCKVKPIGKYAYMFDWLYNNKDSKIYVYIDNVAVFLSLGIIEFWIWVIINKLNPFRFRIVRNIEKTRSDDVFISFLYRNLTFVNGGTTKKQRKLIEKLKKTKAYKVAHLSHYGCNASLGASNSKEAGIDLFISESNLKQNSDFFNRFYSWYKKDIYVMPFVPQKRFEVRTSFSQRINKAMAMGTITYPIEDKDFISFFGNGILQPMRFLIFQNASQVKNLIDSYIAHISDNSKTENRKEPKENNLVKQIRFIGWHIKKRIRLFNHIICIYLNIKGNHSYGHDRAYMKFNIVDEYNKYKMFINAEEVIGLPGIGLVEGMACGTAYIGVKSSMYEDIGMHDGVHYIGYDGSWEDLCKKIAYYQNNEEELKRIAENGYTFVRETCNPDIVMKKFLAFLEKEVDKRKDGHA